MLDWLGIPSILDRIVDFFTISAFWYYLLWGVVVIAGASAAGWFFPALRSAAGSVVLAIVAGLYAYRRGEKDTEARVERKQARLQQRENREPWRWWS